MHPLHTPDFISEMNMMLKDGYERNKHRLTGQTTAIALHTIARAISNPYEKIKIIESSELHINAILVRRITNIIAALDLKFMYIKNDNKNNYFLTFGNKERELENHEKELVRNIPLYRNPADQGSKAWNDCLDAINEIAMKSNCYTFTYRVAHETYSSGFCKYCGKYAADFADCKSNYKAVNNASK